MAFYDLELWRIKNSVGVFCEKKTNPGYYGTPRFDYFIHGQSVIIRMTTSYWKNKSQTIYHDIAKLTYVRTRATWSLYWMRGGGKWERYPPSDGITTLEELVKQIESDSTRCFLNKPK